MSTNNEEGVFQYGDPRIASGNAPIPRWLKFNYLFWPIWGVVCWHFFWNGNSGYFDQHNWGGLQRAANTTFPTENLADLPPEQVLPNSG
ncbi:MAG: hypothetical protein H0X51_10190 [Parachlamydiaceae bacterium]|nr:hypothetical protein [Parachlamydiaceae bacterium]